MPSVRRGLDPSAPRTLVPVDVILAPGPPERQENLAGDPTGARLDRFERWHRSCLLGHRAAQVRRPLQSKETNAMVWNAITDGAGWEPWRELHPLHAPWSRLFSAHSV